MIVYVVVFWRNTIFDFIFKILADRKTYFSEITKLTDAFRLTMMAPFPLLGWPITPGEYIGYNVTINMAHIPGSDSQNAAPFSKLPILQLKGCVHYFDNV